MWTVHAVQGGNLDQNVTSGHNHPEGRSQSLEMAEPPRQGGGNGMQWALGPGASDIKGTEGEEPVVEIGQTEAELGGK